MKHRKGILAGAVLLVALAMPWASAQAMTLGDTNLVDLLRDSESIVVGQVTSLTDGIDAQGMPYTEVTLEITESIRGSLAGTYTFRQFGLREPRLSADGTRKMMPAPEGFPKFEGGEQVALFLNRPARLTGLQTTVGLANGKFTLGASRAENDRGNSGIFSNVSLDAGLATDNDARMLATEAGAVNSDTFLSFVRRAVQNSWVSNCKMWRTDVGKECGGGTPPRKPTTKPGSTIAPSSPIPTGAPKLQAGAR